MLSLATAVISFLDRVIIPADRKPEAAWCDNRIKTSRHVLMQRYTCIVTEMSAFVTPVYMVTPGVMCDGRVRIIISSIVCLDISEIYDISLTLVQKIPQI